VASKFMLDGKKHDNSLDYLEGAANPVFLIAAGASGRSAAALGKKAHGRGVVESCIRHPNLNYPEAARPILAAAVKTRPSGARTTPIKAGMP